MVLSPSCQKVGIGFVNNFQDECESPGYTHCGVCVGYGETSVRRCSGKNGDFMIAVPGNRIKREAHVVQGASHNHWLYSQLQSGQAWTENRPRSKWSPWYENLGPGMAVVPAVPAPRGSCGRSEFRISLGYFLSPLLKTSQPSLQKEKK